jgi:hypothetical protein
MSIRRIAALAFCVVAATTVSATAAADGGPSPGISIGGAGLLRPDGRVRYVAVPTERGAMIESIRAADGRVLRWTVIRGRYFGIPIVAYDQTAGGLSHDRRTLVLASYPGPIAGNGATRFAVFDTHRFRVMQTITLKGAYAYDALAPDTSTLYLIQYTSAQNTNHYRVRAYDLVRRRLLPGAIVDKREPAEAMQGVPMARAESGSGEWVYTLYARPSGAPFIHALNASNRSAICIDLPWRHVMPGTLFGVRLTVMPTSLVLTQAWTGRLAVVDTNAFTVRTVRRPRPQPGTTS